MSFQDPFDTLTEGAPRGTVRMQVLVNATAAQIRAIPVGSDVAYSNPTAFQFGMLDEDVREQFATCAEANECGHLHGFLMYTPPVPAPESTLTVEAIASNAVDLFEPAIRKARSDDPDPDFTERDVLERMVRAAAHTAREGMVFPPF